MTDCEFGSALQKLEINPKHPVIQELLNRVVAGETNDETVELAHILYDTAALRAGYALRNEELVAFSDRIDRIVRKNLGVDLYAQVRAANADAPHEAATPALTLRVAAAALWRMRAWQPEVNEPLAEVDDGEEESEEAEEVDDHEHDEL